MKDSTEFRIVVVYRNLASAIQAREMSDRFAAELEEDCEIDTDFWKFDFFDHWQFREQATAEAARAGMIILASDTIDLPENVKSWIENLPEMPEESFSALVALFDKPTGIEGTTRAICKYLHQIGADRGMDFFCKAGNWWQGNLETLKENRRRRQLPSKYPMILSSAIFRGAIGGLTINRSPQVKRAGLDFMIWSVRFAFP